MKNPKSFQTFLEGFNWGTFLSLISLGGLLMKSSTIQVYSFIIILIITNGFVIGLVRQYLLIQLTLTKNMKKAFMQSENHIPSRLLAMRGYKIRETLTLLVGISTRLRMNLCGIGTLMILIILSLCLAPIYMYRIQSNMLIFTIGWSVLCFLYLIKLIIQITQNCHYLQHQITHLLEINHYNRREFKQKQS